MTSPIDRAKANLTKEDIINAFKAAENDNCLVTPQSIDKAKSLSEDQKVILQAAFEKQKEGEAGGYDDNTAVMHQVDFYTAVNAMGFGPKYQYKPNSRQLNADAYKMFSRSELNAAYFGGTSSPSPTNPVTASNTSGAGQKED